MNVDAKPAFCPACGAKVRYSLAERLGIDGESLWSIMIAIVVLFSLTALVAVITYGIVTSHQNANEHEDTMMRGGYVQQTRIVTPATDRMRAGTVTEWVKQEEKKP